MRTSQFVRSLRLVFQNFVIIASMGELDVQRSSHDMDVLSNDAHSAAAFTTPPPPIYIGRVTPCFLLRWGSSFLPPPAINTRRVTPCILVLLGSSLLLSCAMVPTCVSSAGSCALRVAFFTTALFQPTGFELTLDTFATFHTGRARCVPASQDLPGGLFEKCAAN